MTDAGSLADQALSKVVGNGERKFSQVEIRLRNSEHSENLLSLLQHERFSLKPNSAGSRPLLQHLTVLGAETRSSAIVFVGSPNDGCVVRSDIVSFRLRHVRAITSVYDIAAPCAWVQAMPIVHKGHHHTKVDLEALLSSAISVVIVQGFDHMSLESNLVRLSEELANKLNMPLTTPQPCSIRRVCVVGGGFSPSFRVGMLGAAVAAGMRLVIIDKPGHWMASQTDSCEAFLSVDMTVDEGLCGRLVTACRKYGLQFDGITTFADDYCVPTARAAQMLGLPTDSPDAFDMCTRKDMFRKLFPIENCPSFCATSMEDFHAQADALAYHLPLIVKPRSGANSAGVSKADSPPELEQLVDVLVRSGTAALVEKYVDGPEVDVNIALINGQIAFCDINDGLPCSAEWSGREDAPASFIESKLFWPSILPSSEQSMLRQAALAALKKLGFKQGIFHLEARIIGSSMSWSRENATQLPRLKAREARGSEQPRTMFLEINPRTVGYPGAAAISSCYGIDYALLQLLLCMEDTHRARILSLPFTDLESTSVVAEFILTPRAGVFRGENMFEELKNRFPHMMERVVRKMVFFKDGDEVKDPTERASWVAFFIVKSEKGREHATSISEDIKNSLRYEIL